MSVKWDIGWGIEVRCNMNCEFCYSKDVRMPNNKLCLEVYKDFIDRNVAEISSINYGTGENSLSNDWFNLVEYIGSNYPSIRQALTTNGHIARACKDPRKMEVFDKYIDEVDVSLDFINRDRHNEFRGNPDAYDMAIDALSLCKEHNKTTTLVFLGTDEVVQKPNLTGLFEIAFLNNCRLRSNIYRPTQGITRVAKKYILGYRVLIETLNWISDNHRIIKMSDRLLSAVLFQRKADDHSGLTSLRILGDGSITPSTYLVSNEYRKYNILDGVYLHDISFADQIVRDIVPSKCSNCTYIDLCQGGVFDRRLLWYNTLNERDPYCPFRSEDTALPYMRITDDKDFTSVHDSYLPTMFFAY